MNRDVHLLVQGALLERLLEKALAEGAVFARIRRIDERSMRIETDVRSADTLIRMCRRYSLNCRTLRRGGRTALWDLARRRWTVLPGTALCFVICALFLSRVWLVDIRFTNAQINPDIQRRIAACLEENGIRPGMAASAVDTSHLQTQITASVENLSYAGVRLQGIRLLVETSPEVPAPQYTSATVSSPRSWAKSSAVRYRRSVCSGFTWKNDRGESKNVLPHSVSRSRSCPQSTR